MMDPILPGQTIGIIGAGINAFLLAQRAKERGYVVGILTDQKSTTTRQIADFIIEGNESNAEKVLELAEKSDVLTFDSEWIDFDALLKLKPYINMPQLSEMLSVTQDRLIEKVFLESLNINVSPYATITNIEDIKEAVQSIGFPCVLKPIRLERLQPENVYLYSEEDFGKAERLLTSGTCMLEAWIPFEKEMTITVGLDTDHRLVPFPITEAIYENGELRRTKTPATIEDDMEKAIIQITQTIAEALDSIGLLTLELFTTALGSIYVKGIAVSPHRASDYTLDACNLSQYDVLLRTICGLPLPEIILHQPCLTERILPGDYEEILSELTDHPEWLFRLSPKEKQGLIISFENK